jgi:hypothetical protein
VRRLKTCKVRRISSSLPITGSIFPSLARKVTSTEYFCKFSPYGKQLVSLEGRGCLLTNLWHRLRIYPHIAFAVVVIGNHPHAGVDARDAEASKPKHLASRRSTKQALLLHKAPLCAKQNVLIVQLKGPIKAMCLRGNPWPSALLCRNCNKAVIAPMPILK